MIAMFIMLAISIILCAWSIITAIKAFENNLNALGWLIVLSGLGQFGYLVYRILSL